MTLEDRLERLATRTPPADAADVIAAARTRTKSRPADRRPGPVAAAAAVILVVVLAAGGFALISDEGDDALTVAGPHTAAFESQVTVPGSGASPEELADGTPVWVVRHDDGSVSVLDAVSTHRPFGAGTLVGWCDSSRGFIDPMYGSQFDERGRSQAGPAPRGLSSYPVASVDGSTVTVTGPPVAQPRAAGDQEAAEPAGPDCLDETSAPVSGYLSGSFDLHPFSAETAVTPDEAMRLRDGTLVLVDAAVVIVDGRQPLVCTSEVAGSPPSCEGFPAPQLFLIDETSVVLRGPFIARTKGGAFTHIAYVGERTISHASTSDHSAVPARVLPGWVPEGYQLAWVDTPASQPVDIDSFALHERPHHYAYGYQSETAELEVKVMVGATIDDPQSVADTWGGLATPTTIDGRSVVGYTEPGHTRLLVEVDGGVAMVTTHPLGSSFPDGQNPAIPARRVVERFAASIVAVGDDQWDAALAGADVASRFEPKDGVPVIDGDGWSLIHGQFRAPLSVRHPALWVDFGGTAGAAVGPDSFNDGGWHAAISAHAGTRVAWGVLPPGAETVKVTIGGQGLDATVEKLRSGATVFAVDVSDTIGDGTFQALGPTGASVASGSIEVE